MNGENPALAILDLLAKQIIHRPLGHTEFDARYAELRGKLAGDEPQGDPAPEQEPTVANEQAANDANPVT